MIDIEHLEKLLAEATPGPWRFEQGGGHARDRIVGSDMVQTDGWPEQRNGVGNGSYSERVCENFGYTELPGPKANVDLICQLRNTAPALIAELKAARELAESLRKYVDYDTINYFQIEGEIDDAYSAVLRALSAVERARGYK